MASAARTQRVRRTPLYPVHRHLGAKMVEFAGWEMPVQYRGLIEEHLAVRSRAGLFDVSHMGEIEIRGPNALAVCQSVTANDVSRIEGSQVQYNLLLNENGGIVDDLMVYRLEADHFLLCVNAATTAKDAQWITAHAQGKAEVRDNSDAYAQLALQGPLAHQILQRVTSLRLEKMRPFHFSFGDVCAIRCLVSRTGYTGEDGFELYFDPSKGERLWSTLLDAGSDLGLCPAGLGARDTLRLERAFPLYGHELDENTTPLEAGLEWVTKFSKGPFLGREALLRQRQDGVKRKLVGLEVVQAGIARGGYRIFKQGRQIGQVTSGTMSPTLRKPIALGYVSSQEAVVGNLVEVEVRSRRVLARVLSLPFYGRPAQRSGRH
ncbi:MAG: glycine cleavage system aminomethyltransferase GcvT [Candidatus Binatia bacterium]